MRIVHLNIITPRSASDNADHISQTISTNTEYIIPVIIHIPAERRTIFFTLMKFPIPFLSQFPLHLTQAVVHRYIPKSILTLRILCYRNLYYRLIPPTDCRIVIAVKLCSLISPAVQNSIDLLKAGRYNALVEAALPYQFRTGVVKRSALWEAMPDVKKHDYDGLSENTVQEFKNLIRSGINHEDRIGRMKDFTANDFFRACKIGYEAIGKDCDGYSLSELYIRYSDGRDEGLTGSGLGLNAGPGIDFDSPSAWDSWYYDRDRGGGHPWEVVPGGNSTHVELFVKNDKRHLEWDLRSGKITEEEYQEKLQHAGYYFAIAGMQRQFEAVTFYVALSSAGYPVIIEGAEALLARFEATDYVGIVPHHLPTRYCESLFPDSYGTIVDFTHVYKDEDATWFDKIEWLPEEEAELVNMPLSSDTRT